MELPTLASLERSIGGRPRLEETMIRMSFYLSPAEAQALKSQARAQSLPVSQIVRRIVQEYLSGIAK
ncbi:hypothetical protein GCM10009104_23710 [Marinobacterium maritimum]|uniref:Ribbon-helix-helix protein CopG domain-containing protein n=1 Tax=Marinobacterium maritimum TaxID=500162 RepID=A0ABP3TCZ5_9GAMM